jgi:type II secretory pathway pseudopilin PulG
MKKAFSLVEILIYMGIAAVMISLGFVGITIAQRAARDEERKLVVQEIRSTVDTYFRSTAAYPVESVSLLWETDQVTIGEKSVALLGFKGYSNSATDSSRTRYVYLKDRSGYMICVKLESGDWFRSGNGGDDLTCPLN